MTRLFEPDVFERIIRGELPCFRVWEDDRHVAILDIHPIKPGHTLVIPRRRSDYLFDLESAEYHALLEASRLVARKLKSALGVNRIAMAVAGYDVPHVHVHLIPTNSKADFPAPPSRAPTDNLEAIAERIASARA